MNYHAASRIRVVRVRWCIIVTASCLSIPPVVGLKRIIDSNPRPVRKSAWTQVNAVSSPSLIKPAGLVEQSHVKLFTLLIVKQSKQPVICDYLPLHHWRINFLSSSIVNGFSIGRQVLLLFVDVFVLLILQPMLLFVPIWFASSLQSLHFYIDTSDGSCCVDWPLATTVSFTSVDLLAFAVPLFIVAWTFSHHRYH